MTIRKTQLADLEALRLLYAHAREQMKKNGNPSQWGDSRPSEDTILADIRNSQSYIITEELSSTEKYPTADRLPRTETYPTEKQLSSMEIYPAADRFSRKETYPAEKQLSAIKNAGICGTFAFIIGDDPTYRILEHGHWLNQAPYGTIHRLASSGSVKGIFSTCLAWCLAQIPNIRIDTHQDNLVMQHLLEKNGFHKCGIIYVEDNSPRLAYQKSLDA